MTGLLNPKSPKSSEFHHSCVAIFSVVWLIFSSRPWDDGHRAPHVRRLTEGKKWPTSTVGRVQCNTEKTGERSNTYDYREYVVTAAEVFWS